MDEPDRIDLSTKDVRIVNPRDLDKLGSTGTATGILVAATSWAIAQGSTGSAIILGLLTIGAQIYQWRRVAKLKEKTEPNADIRLIGLNPKQS